MVQKNFKTSMSLFLVDGLCIRGTLVAIAFFLLLFTSGQQAEATLRVYPTRVFMSPDSKSASVSVRNEYGKPASFRAELKFYEMTESGKMIEVQKETPDQIEIRKSFKFSPREFKIGVNQEQLIRILAKMPPATAAAEYRVHLHVSTFEDSDARVIAKESDDTRKLSTELKVHFGVAVPLIFRTGIISQPIKLETQPVMKLSDEKQILQLTIANEGSGSVFGGIKVFSDETKSKLIAELNGVAIYGKQRRFEIPLAQSPTPHGFVEFQNDLDQSITHLRY